MLIINLSVRFIVNVLFIMLFLCMFPGAIF